MPDAFSRIAALFRALGPKTAVLYLLFRTMEWLRLPVRVYCYRLIAQPVPSAPRLKGERGNSLVGREIGPEDSALAEMPLEQETLDHRFGQGARCLGLFREQALVAYIWLTLGAYEEDEVRCRFVPLPEGRASWDFDLYVLPAYRLSPAFLKMWDVADAFLREHGVAWSCSRISAFNLSSVRSHARLGGVDLGGADFLVAGPVQILLSSRAPWVHITATRRSRPVVPLDTSMAESGPRTAAPQAAAPAVGADTSKGR